MQVEVLCEWVQEIQIHWCISSPVFQASYGHVQCWLPHFEFKSPSRRTIHDNSLCSYIWLGARTDVRCAIGQ